MPRTTTIEVRQLRCFIAVADAGSFRAGANVLGALISSISRSIASLEEALATDLFTRHHRGARLTGAGERILPIARRIMADVERAHAEGLAAAQARAGRLTIGVNLPLSGGPLRDSIAAFRVLAPDVQMELAEAGSPTLVGRLERQEIDVAIGTALPAFRELVALDLWTEPLLAALPIGNPLALLNSITWTDLVGTSLIFGTAKSASIAMPLRVETSRSVSEAARFARWHASRHAVLSAVGMGLGCTVVEASAAATSYSGVVFRPISEPDAEVQVTALWHPENNNPVRQKFVAELRDRTRPKRS